MPGSIQVSVLDFKELPSNSVKISLGKVEHEAGKDGNFSFPLANLRDNLIITVEDSEGNQVSQSGVRTMSVIEKGIWDDVFPIGGGLLHMKLQFCLSEEERNRIRLMRESAIKKKQAEILGSRHEVSQGKASEFCDGPKEESFQMQSITNVIDKREETSFPHMTQEIEQKPKSSNNLVEKLYETLKEKILNDVKETNEESTLNKNNAVLLRQAEVPEKLLENTKTRDYLKNSNAVKSKPLYDQVEKLDKQILEDKNLSFIKKLSKESKFPPLAKETEVNAFENNEIQLQETDLLERLQDSSSSDVGSSRLTVAEKMKSFSPKLVGEMDKRSSLEKIPQNIKKMIGVFESTISQDGVPLKTVSAKSYRFGTSRLVQDYYEKSSSLKNSEDSSLSRLRNSFTQGDKAISLLSDCKIEENGHQEKDGEIESPESAYVEASNGSFGQAMKIALVVGFGVLAFLFRQRESGNQVFMNRRGSTEEQGRRFGVSRLS